MSKTLGGSCFNGDHKVLVDSLDATAGFLDDKLGAGANISFTTINVGGNEKIVIAAIVPAGTSDHKVLVDGGDTTATFLGAKLAAGAAITLTVLNPGANEQIEIAVSGLADAQVSAGAAIAGTKISPNFGAQNILTSGTVGGGAATFTSITDSGLGIGVVHSDAGGLFSSSLIVNADVDAAAAIAGTKIDPNFGAQNIVTTGAIVIGATPATVGDIRVKHNFIFNGRNNANSANREVLSWGFIANDTIRIGDNTVAGVRLQGTSVDAFTGSTKVLSIGANGILFDNGFAATAVIQQTSTAAGATGQQMDIHAQDVSGAGTIVGGALVTRAGNGGAASSTNSTGGKRTDAAGDASGGSATNIGGNSLYRAGRGSGAGTKDGSIAIHADPASFQAMERGLFLGNVVTAPAGDPASGGFLYVVAGALTWRGSGGTVTVLGAA